MGHSRRFGRTRATSGLPPVNGHSHASQGAVLVFPAEKTGTEATVPMVFAGFVSSASNVPGPYGAFELAKATVARNTRTDPEGKSSVDEILGF